MTLLSFFGLAQCIQILAYFPDALTFFVTFLFQDKKVRHNVKRPHAEPAEVKTTWRPQRTYSNCTLTPTGLGKKA